MTPTEIIATRLLGWVRVEPTRDDPKVYEHPTGSTAYVGGELDGTGYGPVGGADWPDLTDYNWIRRMENALREQGLYEGPPSKPSYVRELRRIVGLDVSDYYVATFATAAQRVEAAVKVLEGQG